VVALSTVDSKGSPAQNFPRGRGFFVCHSRIAAMGRLSIAPHYLHPHIPSMTSWKPKPREPAKTKAELREMLAQAVRNTAQPPKPKRPPKAKTGAAND
jgi:hypothetical protein